MPGFGLCDYCNALLFSALLCLWHALFDFVSLLQRMGVESDANNDNSANTTTPSRRHSKNGQGQTTDYSALLLVSTLAHRRQSMGLESSSSPTNQQHKLTAAHLEAAKQSILILGRQQQAAATAATMLSKAKERRNSHSQVVALVYRSLVGGQVGVYPIKSAERTSQRRPRQLLTSNRKKVRPVSSCRHSPLLSTSQRNQSDRYSCQEKCCWRHLLEGMPYSFLQSIN